MRKAYIFLALFILVLGSVLAYLYYDGKFDYKDKDTYINISLIAVSKGSPVITGFEFSSPRQNVKGNTSKSYELLEVLDDGIVKFKNVNLEGQKYFTTIRSVNTSKGNQRVILNLDEPKSISYTITGDNPKTVKITSEDSRDVNFCISWSNDYIFVKASGYEESEILDSWDRCYKPNIDLLKSSEYINISYTIFQNPDSQSYINLLLYQEGLFDETSQIVKIK